MDIGKSGSTAIELRRCAEERLKAEASEADASLVDDEMPRLLHELQVHQIELEMQNAELRQTRDKLETALETYTELYDFAPVSYITLDSGGAIRAVNIAGACLIGGLRSQLIGQPFWTFIVAADRSAFTEFLCTVLGSPVKGTCEVTLLGKENQPVIVRIEAMATASGHEFRLALIDITSRNQLETEIRDAR